MKQKEEKPTPLGIALKRSDFFKRSITNAAPTTAKRLIAAWRKVIVEQFKQAVKTEDLDDLGALDCNPAVIVERMGRRQRGGRQ